ncbi:MAG: ribosomal protein S18-alanine N-acetyltransferase [Candidatus Paracaedibacteraceae bacterium]|nr:ribosomal protein S18-alanine N-acetyltransferase [Candidatus Paracaedibacteraceae bacterium]
MSLNLKNLLDFRRLRSEDSPACLNILKAAFTTPWEELDFIFQTPSHALYGVFIQNNLTGFIAVSIMIDESEILNLAVHPDHQQKGIGKALLTHTIQVLKNQQIKKIFLEVDITNIPAQRLYQHTGFQIMGYRKAYYPQPDGTFHDAAVMQLKL